MRNVSDSITDRLREPLGDVQSNHQLRTHNYRVEPVRKYNAEEVRNIRSELGISQTSFANVMGVSKKTVEAWESGRNTPAGPASRILSLLQADPSLLECYHIIEK
jgi:putative transcriptional regulator